ncbi:MAG: hypothetical protein ACREMF_09225 [Gemmatimonadales bacterium]
MTAVRSALLVAVLSGAACDDGLTPRPRPTTCPTGFVGLCGTVTFRGALPESTDAVFIVAYATFPTSQSELFDFQPVPPPMLLLDSAARADSQPYLLPLPSGTYEWVLAAWKKQGTLTPANADSLLREAGFFRDPADTTQPGSVDVSGTGRDSINFVVDFTNMHPVSFYFPAAAQRR